eukprot:gene3098-9986_t
MIGWIRAVLSIHVVLRGMCECPILLNGGLRYMGWTPHILPM